MKVNLCTSTAGDPTGGPDPEESASQEPANAHG